MRKIIVSFPNIGEDLIDVEIVKTWKPKDIKYIGEKVFFIEGDTTLSINKTDFEEIFNKNNMGVIKSIETNHFGYREKKGRALNDGYKMYWFFDIHGTILKPNYQYRNTPKDFYPYAEECLQYLSKINDITMVLYTCSHPHEIQEYVDLFAKSDIKFAFINENPDVKTEPNGYGCYDKKPYMNVLFEDKAGFDPETEWKAVLDYMKSKYGDR